MLASDEITLMLWLNSALVGNDVLDAFRWGRVPSELDRFMISNPIRFNRSLATINLNAKFTFPMIGITGQIETSPQDGKDKVGQYWLPLLPIVRTTGSSRSPESQRARAYHGCRAPFLKQALMHGA
jgi:hypothetical protein